MDYRSLIHIPRPSADANIRLVCFSYAGGSARSYLPWLELLPDNVELAVVQLPGRTLRFAEPLYHRMEPLICDLLEHYQRLAVKPAVFFGHSMGARVAYAFTLAMFRLRMPLPCRLIASASPAPLDHSAEILRHTLPDDEFLEMLSGLQGFDGEVLMNEELRHLMLPVLRADFSVIDTYQPRFKGKLPTTVSVFAGIEDSISKHAMEGWFARFSGNTGIDWIDGDHFYIDKEPTAVIAALKGIFEQIGERSIPIEFPQVGSYR